MNGNLVRIVSIAVCFLPAAYAYAQQGLHPVLDAPGFREHRDYFSEMPFENIDTLTGSLVLRFTDLVLPANAGRELRFERTFNSKGPHKWSFGIAGIPLHISNPPAPIEAPHPQDATPALLMSDGSARKLAWYSFPDKAISSEFWLFDRTGSLRRLYFPNGDTCEYEIDPDDQYGLRIASCKDVYDNQTVFTWLLAQQPPKLEILQNIASGEERLVTVVFSSSLQPWNQYPTKLQYDVREWQFSLGRVSPPGTGTPEDRPGWNFGYDGSNRLTTVTTPHGGIITYTYATKNYEGPDPQATYSTEVIATRSTGGRDIDNPGTWEYFYEISPAGISGETTVLTPSGRIKYRHGTSPALDPQSYFDGEAGILPLMFREVESCTANCGGPEESRTFVRVEREDRAYTFVPSLAGNILGSLELETRTITRYDASQTPTTYTTTFDYDPSYFGNFHNPNEIVETGPAGTRTTERSFFPPTSTPYVLVLPESEDVTVGSETFTKTWTYDSLGFKTSEVLYGVATEFTRDSRGNLRSVKKANNKVTQFRYQHGQVQAMLTPMYTVTLGINGDGTVDSETRAGRTTGYEYDSLGRLKKVHPPGGTNFTEIRYVEDNGYLVATETQRGSSLVVTELDGFGRPRSIIDAANVSTAKEYDAEGRVIREGYPVPNGSQSFATEISYDALGRITAHVNPDTTGSTRAYGANGVVTVTESLGLTLPPRSTQLTSHGFGTPDERLVNVRDANGQDWAYGYNALGKLTSVVAEDGATRTWAYNSKNLLATETHPELGDSSGPGTNTYTYDIAGQLASKTDAKGVTTSYTRDDNDRIKRIEVANRVTTILYEPGSDNRTAAVNPFAGVFFDYDSSGRVHLRQNAIDGKLFSTSYEYDANDNLLAIQYPSGRRIQHVVNTAGRSTKVFESAASRNYADNIVYHPSGGVQSYMTSNGVGTTIEYDPLRYWIKEIESGPLLLTYDNYDGVGNPWTIHDSRAGYGQTLTYDTLDRLTSAEGIYGEAEYAYDIHGNRVSTPSATYQYETGKLRLSSQPGATPSESLR